LNPAFLISCAITSKVASATISLEIIGLTAYFWAVSVATENVSVEMSISAPSGVGFRYDPDSPYGTFITALFILYVGMASRQHFAGSEPSMTVARTSVGIIPLAASPSVWSSSLALTTLPSRSYASSLGILRSIVRFSSDGPIASIERRSASRRV
jgi:hypothetical protein